MAPANPLQGQQLPKDWPRQAANHGGTFDRRNLSEMWKRPLWASKFNNPGAIQNITQSGRLGVTNQRETEDRADSVRLDAQMHLVSVEANGLELWQDQFGHRVWRRMK